MASLVPPTRKAKHGWLMRILVIISSAIGGFLFLFTVVQGAIFYHLGDLVLGREKQNAPKKENSVHNYTPRQPYPDMKGLKITKDLRYYALQLGLDLEEFDITTEDGYILKLHHIFDPKEAEADRHKRQPILLQHGLLLCSGAWLAPGKNSLPFHFWEEGYDVWMGNNRCWFEPKHATLKGNLMHNEEFWNWDVRSFAYYDLPCIIDNVLLRCPNYEQLVLVGHSQGCTQSFLLLKNEAMAHYHTKIKHFFGLAPAIFPGSLFHYRRFIKFIHNRGPRGYTAIFGSCCFLTLLGQTRKLIGTTRFFSLFSYQVFKYLFGWNLRNNYPDSKILHVQFLFNVTYISADLMSWWLSHRREDGFSNQLQPKQAYKDGSNFAFTPVNTNVEEGENVEKQRPANTPPHIDDETQNAPHGEYVPVTDTDLEQTIQKDDSNTMFPYKSEWFSFNTPEHLVPITAFIGGQDFLVDGRRLQTHMNHYERRFYKTGDNLNVIEIPEYNHLDVIWALNVIGQIGKVVTETLAGTGTSKSG